MHTVISNKITRSYFAPLSLLVAFLLSACSHQPVATNNSVTEGVPPTALKFSANVQFLATHQQPDWRTQSYGYLLFGDSTKLDEVAARKSCQALFNEQTLFDKPKVATSTQMPVTYITLSQAQNYHQVSARFKWAACNSLASKIDKQRETALLEQFGLNPALGPWLVHIPQPYRDNSQPKAAVALSLNSAMTGNSTAQLVNNWKEATRAQPSVGAMVGDLEALTQALQLKAKQSLLVTRFVSNTVDLRLSMK